MKTYSAPHADPVEVDVFVLIWPHPTERKSVCVQLWRWEREEFPRVGALVWFDTFEVHQFPAAVEEWTLGPVPIEDAPWWLEEKLREEIGRT